MTTSILFLTIMVLLLLSVFLIFKVTHARKNRNNKHFIFLLKLTTRVESLENILDNIQDYVKKVTQNSTELPLITDRMNPGITEKILDS